MTIAEPQVALSEECIDDLGLYGVVIVYPGKPKLFGAFACLDVSGAVLSAICMVEICERIVITSDHIKTIVFLGRCADPDAFANDAWWGHDLERRGAERLDPKKTLQGQFPLPKSA
jgi:hypothetical protein